MDWKNWSVVRIVIKNGPCSSMNDTLEMKLNYVHPVKVPNAPIGESPL